LAIPTASDTKTMAFSQASHEHRSDAARRSVIVADPIHAAGIDRLHATFNTSYLSAYATDGSRDAALETSDALVVRVFQATEALMDRMPRLKLIVKHGSGVDNINIPAATKRGILVINTPGGANATAVAEGAVTLMLSILRRTRDMDDCVRQNRYAERATMQLRDLWGATLGLIGFGQIGRVTARIGGAGFNMPLYAFDPFVSAEEMAALKVDKVETLVELMGLADVVSVHVPLTDATHHLVDAAALRAMKPSAILINTSRGSLVDEAALIAALQEKRLAGAGLDVFELEPPEPDNPLFAMRNVALSPHVAGVTESSLRDMALNVAKVIEGVFVGTRPATLLNAEIWETRRT
jgi:phosphoglycerate dehydrogenase-like enzyme